MRISENVDPSNYNVYVDSLTLKLMLKFIGVSSERRSGFAAFQKKDNSFYLVAQKYEDLYPSEVLPCWITAEDIIIDKDWCKIIRDYDNIFIGISGPKHDVLAFQLNKYYPEKNFFCFGAAMYSNSKSFDKYGLNWLYMLVKNPRRTAYKLVKTLSEMFLIVFNKEKKYKFRLFANTI